MLGVNTTVDVSEGSVVMEVTCDASAASACASLAERASSGNLELEGLDSNMGPTTYAHEDQNSDGMLVGMVVACTVAALVVGCIIFAIIALKVKSKKRKLVSQRMTNGNLSGGGSSGLPPSYRSFHFENTLEGTRAREARRAQASARGARQNIDMKMKNRAKNRPATLSEDDEKRTSFSSASSVLDIPD